VKGWLAMELSKKESWKLWIDLHQYLVRITKEAENYEEDEYLDFEDEFAHIVKGIFKSCSQETLFLNCLALSIAKYRPDNKNAFYINSYEGLCFYRDFSKKKCSDCVLLLDKTDNSGSCLSNFSVVFGKKDMKPGASAVVAYKEQIYSHLIKLYKAEYRRLFPTDTEIEHG
jgi:hypothetical protein